MAVKNVQKHVLLVVRWPVGGIRTFLRYVYRDFNPDNWCFTMVAPENPETRMLVEEDLAHLPITYHVTDDRPSPLEFTSHVLSVLMRKRFDLVHSHGFTSGFCTSVVATLFRKKHILTSHDVLNPAQFAGSKGRIKHWGMARLLGTMDRIHSVSEDAQSNLIEYFPNLAQERLVVIPNGIEAERFQGAAPRDFRRELGLGNHTFLIGFMGRFMAQKGFRYLVDAIELLRRRQDIPAYPVVLTFGYGGFIREEKSAISNRGLEGHFRFLPFVANTASSIRGLDVLAMPSLWEACPLQPMEALVCGTPLIATNCVGLREVVRNTPATVVPPRDAQALADAILEHMRVNKVEEFQDFRSSAAVRFDARKTADRIKLLYENF